MTEKHLTRFSSLFIILSAIFWGGLFIFVRTFNAAGFTSSEIVFMRCSSSVFWLFFWVSFTERKRIISNGFSAVSFKLKDSWCFAGSGIISIVFFSWCYFKNVSVSSAAFAAVLMYTSPIFVMLISALIFKEHISPKKLSALIIAITGTFLVSGITPHLLFTKGTAVPVNGLLLGLGSAVGYALYSIFSTLALSRGYSPLIVTFYTFCFAAVGAGVLIDLPQLLSRLSSCGFFPLAFAMGLLGSCIPFALYTIGLSGTEPGKAAILATLEPIVTTIFGIIFYGEVLALTEIIGIIFVLTAAVLVAN